MSELLVNTIKKADGTGALSVPAESGTVVTTASPSLGRRNLIINGAMQVAQRGTSVTGKTSSTTYTTVDRWKERVNGQGSWDISQSTDSPEGFAYSCKWECATADASPAAGDFLIFEQKFEGQNLQQLGYGTANAKSLTASFWVKSNKTGVYTVGFFSADNSARHINSSYTINSANTWEYKTVTLAGDTSASLDNDANESMKLWFWLGAGTNFSSGTQATSWEAYDTTKVLADNQVNLADTIGNTWQITGVQLEVGSVATPFEHRSYNDEWLSCVRYYWRITGQTDGTARFANGGYWSGSGWQSHIKFPVPMRTGPSLVANSGTDYYVINTTTNDYINSLTIDGSNIWGCSIYNNTEASGTGGNYGMLSGGTANSAMIAFNAEL